VAIAGEEIWAMASHCNLRITLQWRMENAENRENAEKKATERNRFWWVIYNSNSLNFFIFQNIINN